jgi:hypothetical protein
VRAVSHGFEGTHGLRRSSDAFVNIAVVTQAKGNIGAKVFEVAAEGDLSVGDRDRNSLLKVVVEELFSCSVLLHRLFLLLFSLGKCVIDVVVQSIIKLVVGFLNEGGGEHRAEKSRRRNEYTPLRFGWCSLSSNVHFEAKSRKVMVNEVNSLDQVVT